MIRNYDNFLFEKYGSNELVRKLTFYLEDVINKNIGKLILNKKIVLNGSLKNFTDINFLNDEIEIVLSNETHGGVYLKLLLIDNNKIENLKLVFKMVLSPVEKTSKKLNRDNKIINIISHEFLHVVELFLTKLNNNLESRSWEYGDRLKILKKKYLNSCEFQKVEYLIYLSLPHEIRARIEQLNKNVEQKNIIGIKKTQEYIKTTKIYKDVDFLSTINIDKILLKLKKLIMI